MPLSKKGNKIMKNMKKEYGSKKGENVFYASKNKGTIKGVELKDDDFQQHEEVKGTASKAMKLLMDRTSKIKAAKARALLMKSNRKDEVTIAPQRKPSKGMKSTSITRKLKSGEYNRAGKGGGPRISRVGVKQKETDDKRDHGSIRDHKLLAYKDLAYRMDELLGSIVTGAATAIGSMGTKKVLSKSAKDKAEEKRKAELEAKKEIQAEGKTIEKTKDALRVAGLAPGVGAAADAGAGAITLGQRALAKDPKRKKQLNKELAGDAAALVPGAGQVTRSAQLAAKAGKAVRGTKRAGKLAKVRGRAGAAIRKHGDKVVDKGAGAAASHLRKKSMEDETQMNNAYVRRLMEMEGPTDKELKAIKKEKPAKIPKKKYFGGATDPKKVDTRAAIASHKKGIRAAGEATKPKSKETNEGRSSFKLRQSATQSQGLKRRKDTSVGGPQGKEVAAKFVKKALAGYTKPAIGGNPRKPKASEMNSHTEYHRIGRLFVESEFPKGPTAKRYGALGRAKEGASKIKDPLVKREVAKTKASVDKKTKSKTNPKVSDLVQGSMNRRRGESRRGKGPQGFPKETPKEAKADAEHSRKKVQDAGER